VNRVLYGRGHPALMWCARLSAVKSRNLQLITLLPLCFFGQLCYMSVTSWVWVSVFWWGQGTCPSWMPWECPVHGSAGSCSGSLPVPLPAPRAACLPQEPAVAMPGGFSAGRTADPLGSRNLMAVMRLICSLVWLQKIQITTQFHVCLFLRTSLTSFANC